MAPWRWRLALRRARVQAGLIAVVLLVSVVAATLLSTLFLLDHATATFATRQAISNTSNEQRSVVYSVNPTADLATIYEDTDRAAAASLAGLSTTRSSDVIGKVSILPTGDDSYVLGYMASSQRMTDGAALIDGRWPASATATDVEVAVPAVALKDLHLRVGGTFELKVESSSKDAITMHIVGVYTPLEPGGQAWHSDLLDGDGYTASYAVPGSFRGLVAPLYGPFLTTDDGVETLSVNRVDLSYVPDLSGASVGDLGDMVQRLGPAQTVATQQLGPDAERVSVFAPLSDTVGSISASVTMTRSNLVVSALLLIVLATVALMQTARLLAERRIGEQHLLASRGGSGSQSFALGLVEAVILACVTVGIAAPAARASYLALTERGSIVDAGFHQDPGLPLGTWLAAAVIGVLLVAVLVTPLLRGWSQMTHADQARSRPGKRAAFQRSGLDLAALVVAVLAFWQLRMYRSPVSSGHTDWLLSAGPALALLAGGMLAARLVPLAARGLEALASRGRSATMPLAAWEVGRRPARAVAAVLLLTLAVSIGTFALGFNTTWSASQKDQAIFRHPQDAIVNVDDVEWFAQRELLDAGRQDAAVIDSSAEVSQQSLTDLWYGDESFRGEPSTFIAADNHAWATFTQGRLGEVRGYTLGRQLTWKEPEAAPGIAVADGSDGIGIDLAAKPALKTLTDVLVAVRAMVEHDGDLASVDLGVIPADGQTHRLEGDIGGSVSGLQVVGLQFTLVSTGDAQLSQADFNAPRVDVAMTVSAVAGLTPVQGWSLQGVKAPSVATDVDPSAMTSWTKTSTGGVLATVSEGDKGIDFAFTSSIGALSRKPVSTVITAAPQVGTVPVVGTSGLLQNIRAQVGDPLTLRVGAATVNAVAAGAVPIIPGVQGDAVAVPLHAVQLAAFQSGGAVPTTNAWWLSGPDAASRAAASGGAVSTHDQVLDSLTTDPLRITIPTAIWLVVGASAVLAALGFAIHVVVSTRARELELAQLAAVGMRRIQLARMLAAESSLLAAMGALFGLALGLSIVNLVGPLVAFGPDGKPPLPGVIVHVPWHLVASLALEVVLVEAVAIAIVTVVVRRINPANLLRQGDAR